MKQIQKKLTLLEVCLQREYVLFLGRKNLFSMIFCFFFITTKGNLIAFYYILRITDNGYYEQTTQITTNSKDHDGVWKTGIKSFLVVTSAKFVLFWNFLFICFYQICRISLNFKTWMLLLPVSYTHLTLPTILLV